MNHTVSVVLLVGLTALTTGSRAESASGLPQPNIPAGLGVNIHFVDPKDRDIDLLVAAGFGFVRMDLNWHRVERQKGQYEFRRYEQLVDALTQRGIRVLFILDYENKLYCSERAIKTIEARQAFANFAVAAVTKFKGRSVIWELWNEPNNPEFWRPQPNAEAYMAMAKVVLPAMRQADSDAIIVAPATTTIDLRFLEMCFQRGLLEFVDAVSVHPYRESAPETVSAGYKRLCARIARYAPRGKENLPIISSEWGYTATVISPREQGKYLARTFLVNLMENIPLSIWYDWRDDGTDPKNPEQHFGMVTVDFEPKQAYNSAQELIRELKGYHFVKRVALRADNDYALLFTDGQTQKLALWTTFKKHSIVLPTISKQSVEVTENPKYLTIADPLP